MEECPQTLGKGGYILTRTTAETHLRAMPKRTFVGALANLL